jgi:hypothetical protein
MDIEELIKIGKYLEEKKTAMEDDDIDYSDDEGDAVDEGVPEVRVDERGFHSLV